MSFTGNPIIQFIVSTIPRSGRKPQIFAPIIPQSTKTIVDTTNTSKRGGINATSPCHGQLAIVFAISPISPNNRSPYASALNRGALSINPRLPRIRPNSSAVIFGLIFIPASTVPWRRLLRTVTIIIIPRKYAVFLYFAGILPQKGTFPPCSAAGFLPLPGPVMPPAPFTGWVWPAPSGAFSWLLPWALRALTSWDSAFPSLFNAQVTTGTLKSPWTINTSHGKTEIAGFFSSTHLEAIAQEAPPPITEPGARNASPFPSIGVSPNPTVTTRTREAAKQRIDSFFLAFSILRLIIVPECTTSTLNAIVPTAIILADSSMSVGRIPVPNPTANITP